MNNSVFSCAPQRADCRVFTLREDFMAICHYNLKNAAVLSIAEIKTNEIISAFRQRRDIQDHTLPAEELRWFNLTLREMEALTLGLLAHSTFRHALLPKSQSRIPSLFQLGFLRSRFVAYAPTDPNYRKHRTKQHDVPVHRDVYNRQYIILGIQEYEEKIEDTIYNVMEESFPVFSRQFLLCLDRVNAAIDTLDWD